jgi:dTDP-4-amino-4,6-dideoxygalactose transaminase
MSTTPPPPIPLVDLQRSIAPDRAAIDAAIASVVSGARFILGPDVEGFETELCAYLGGGRHGVGVSNGSDALVMALMALEVGPGDEVIVPAYSFAATATCVVLVGAEPVFVDVVEDGLHMDPAALAEALSPRTRAVIPVHLFGRPADWSRLEAALRDRPDVTVIEDAAQALGAFWTEGNEVRRVGALGRLACFSFFPAKTLGCFGDGGFVATSDPHLAERLRAIRVHGRTGAYQHAMMGVNGRLDALQAAILRVRLRRLDEWVAARRTTAAAYRVGLAPLVAEGHLSLPPGDGDGRFGHSYSVFSLRVHDGRRDALQRHLAAHGIGTAVYYPLPLPYQPCFASVAQAAVPGDFPVSDRLAAESLALPVFPGLRDDELARVVESIGAFYAGDAR